MEVGAIYSSWKEFEEVFKKFQKETGSVFTKRDSQSFGFEGPITDTFKYRVCYFECKHGKQRHASTAKKRLAQRSR